MPLLLKTGAIFLHVPKTGGSWVTQNLHDQNLVRFGFGAKHADVSRMLLPEFGGFRLRDVAKLGILARFLRRSSRPYIFFFVRNPFTWYESWFKYQSDPARAWRPWGTSGSLVDWHPNAEINGIGAEEFNVFMRRMVETEPGYVSRLYARFDALAGMHVCKLERMREDLIDVLDRTGANFDPERIRTSQKVLVSRKAGIEWDPAIRRRVAACDMPAFVRYGYETE